MIKIQDKSLCVGCSSCVQKCPKSCISMLSDKEGFLYPKVDSSKCINCGLCEKSCPVIEPSISNKYDAEAYACFSKNEDTRLNSSSGGIFSEFATDIINRGGVVFGAAFTKDFSVEHIGVDKINDLYKLRGSKYLQSRIGNTYSSVENILKTDKPVLFSGTPCQVSGLLKYLGKSYANLITVDFICHGVPSPIVWNRYLDYVKKKKTSEIYSVSFRDKVTGWNEYSISFSFADCSTYSNIFYKDPYMSSFLKNLSLRSSCFTCHFKGIERCSDITLGDFWGIKKILPEIDDDKGCSVVLLNSAKGNDLFDSLKNNFEYIAVEKEKAFSDNSAALLSPTEPDKRNSFFAAIQHNKDFDYLTKKFINHIDNIFIRFIKSPKYYLAKCFKILCQKFHLKRR